MTAADWIKLAIILPIFFGLGPMLGAAVKKKPEAQKWLFAAMCVMTMNGLFAAGNWGLTLASVEKYRGHAKGYHFYFNHIFAIALITAAWLRDRQSFRPLPPGIFLYLLFVFCCTLSIVNAPRIDYVLMAAHKMLFFFLIALAAFGWMKGRAELQFFIKVLGAMMCWQALIVLKLKYLQGMYQVRGTFEHQNPLAMFATLAGMVLFATALGPDFPGRHWATAGFLSCGIIVQSALSRASLAMFAAGVVCVALVSLFEKPTGRRLKLLSGLGMVGALGLLLTIDTIIHRFNTGNAAEGDLREALNIAARQMADDHFLGVGWNHYALCINTPYRYADVIYDWTRSRGMPVDESKPNAPVESHYYLLLGENGHPGLVSWLLVIGVGLWRNFRGFLAFKHGFERCLCLGIMSGCSLNYVQSTLERVLTQPRNLMLWLILFGVTARMELMRRSLKAKAPALAETETPARKETSPLSLPAPTVESWPAQTAFTQGLDGVSSQFPTPRWANS